MILKLEFSKPPGLNEIINKARTHKFAGAGQKRKYGTIAKKETLKQKPKSFKDKVWLQPHIQCKSILNDQDNLYSSTKFILDALVDTEIILNDNIKIIQDPIIYTYEANIKDPKVILTFTDCPKEYYNLVEPILLQKLLGIKP